MKAPGDARQLTRLSKLLSLVLRHQPQAMGLALDAHGWVEVAALVAACRARGEPVTEALVRVIVETSPKRRFALSEDGLCIRASQGHSVEVDLGYPPSAPPEGLFHGTVAARLESIRRDGLRRMRRRYVHLSQDVATARMVGRRRGAPVVLVVAAGRMHQDGHLFFLSPNGVWLTEGVPPGYLALLPVG